MKVLNRDGISILEVTVALGLASFSMAALGTLLEYSNVFAFRTRAVSARDSLENEIRQLLMKQAAVELSAKQPGNDYLRACTPVGGTALPGPAKCQHLSHYGFSLYTGDSAGSQISGPGASEIEGTPTVSKAAVPFYYDAMARPCGIGPERPSPNCIVRVTTWFQPYCHAWHRQPDGSCIARPEYTQYYYSIEVDRDPVSGNAPYTKHSGVMFLNYDDWIVNE